MTVRRCTKKTRASVRAIVIAPAARRVPDPLMPRLPPPHQLGGFECVECVLARHDHHLTGKSDERSVGDEDDARMQKAHDALQEPCRKRRSEPSWEPQGWLLHRN
jgi:hypothetical protein